MMTRGYYIHPHTVIRGYLTTSHTRDQIDGAIARNSRILRGVSRETLELGDFTQRKASRRRSPFGLRCGRIVSSQVSQKNQFIVGGLRS